MYPATRQRRLIDGRGLLKANLLSAVRPIRYDLLRGLPRDRCLFLKRLGLRMQVSRDKTIEILLVEDSEADAELTTRALQKGPLNSAIHHVTDGVEAMDYLRCQGKYGSARRPDLILLDLNMPRMNGKEVLKELSVDETLRLIPVVILTTSDYERDVLDSYGLNSNAYIVKPVDVKQFMSVVQTLQGFRGGVIRLPPK
ncbi:MAG: response regulator [Planctomycetota bacterium]